MFRNMKIAITDPTHLKAVCDVLESMGYEKSDWDDNHVCFVCASEKGFYSNYGYMGGFWDEHLITLTDLLKMRDEMVKEKARFNSQQN